MSSVWYGALPQPTWWISDWQATNRKFSQPIISTHWRRDNDNALQWRHNGYDNAITSQINSLTIVYSKVYSGADQRKHENSASLAYIQGHTAANVSIWWRHHGKFVMKLYPTGNQTTELCVDLLIGVLFQRFTCRISISLDKQAKQHLRVRQCWCHVNNIALKQKKSLSWLMLSYDAIFVGRDHINLSPE